MELLLCTLFLCLLTPCLIIQAFTAVTTTPTRHSSVVAQTRGAGRHDLLSLSYYRRMIQPDPHPPPPVDLHHHHRAPLTRTTTTTTTTSSSSTRLSASLLTLNGDDGIETVTIPPLRSIDGEISLPGSNVASQYVLMLAALSRGNTTITGILSSDDCSQMREGLYRLGTGITPLMVLDKKSLEPPVLEICGGSFLSELNVEASPYRLWMGTAETTLELLMTVLACAGGVSPEISFGLDGMQGLRTYNVEALVAHIKALTGVSVSTNQGCPPVTIPGVSARNVPSEIFVTSAKQCLPALLIAAPLLDEDIIFHIVGDVPPDIPLVLALMELFGVRVTSQTTTTPSNAVEEGITSTSFAVSVGSRYQSPGYVMMEGDAVSASYLLAGAAITGGTVKVHGCGRRSLQPEVKFVHILEQMGATVEWEDMSIQVTRDRTTKLMGVNVDCTHLSESAMTLAILALFASGTTVLRHLSWSEERMQHMVSECRKAGAGVDSTIDSLTIYPPTQVKNYVVYETYDDHRMAMAFSLVACGGVTAIIKNPSVTAKSFPTFFKVLKMAATIQTVP